MSAGLSMFDTYQRADKKAMRFPEFGSIVVEIIIPDDALVRSVVGSLMWRDAATICDPSRMPVASILRRNRIADHGI